MMESITMIENIAMVISIVNHKGGVGKTTCTLNIGAALANRGKKVLLIDTDPQANLTTSMGFDEERLEITMYELMKHDVEFDEVVLQYSENLHLIPASLALSGVEVELSNEIGREMILREIIDTIKNKYDFILIDCPPSLGMLTINALVASTKIFIPLQTQYLALKGLTKLIEVIERIKKKRINSKLEIGGIIATMYDKRKILHREMQTAVAASFDGKLFKTAIRENISLAEAPGSGKDIFTYAPDSIGAYDFSQLCNEILELEN